MTAAAWQSDPVVRARVLHLLALAIDARDDVRRQAPGPWMNWTWWARLAGRLRASGAPWGDVHLAHTLAWDLRIARNPAALAHTPPEAWAGDPELEDWPEVLQ